MLLPVRDFPLQAREAYTATNTMLKGPERGSHVLYRSQSMTPITFSSKSVEASRHFLRSSGLSESLPPQDGRFSRNCSAALDTSILYGIQQTSMELGIRRLPNLVTDCPSTCSSGHCSTFRSILHYQTGSDEPG